MVECHLAKVEVAGPNPVSRSKKACRYGALFVFAKSAAIEHTFLSLLRARDCMLNRQRTKELKPVFRTISRLGVASPLK